LQLQARAAFAGSSSIDQTPNLVTFALASPHNVVPACCICNYAKRDMTTADFAAWAKRIGSCADQWADPQKLTSAQPELFWTASQPSASPPSACT